MNCKLSSWLTKYKPEEKKVDESVLAVMASGNDVGDLAMGLFGEFVEVTVLKEDGSPNISEMIERTKEELSKKTNVICEASFDYNGLYCAVDILKKTEDGYAIYEVKSSKKYAKNEYVLDIAYQNYVLTKCGVNVKGTYLVHLNPDYKRGKELQLDELFAIKDMSEKIAQVRVEEDLAEAEKILGGGEPVVELSEACRKPHNCPYWEYCTRNIKKPSVFDLYDMYFTTKLKLFKEGKSTFEDVRDTKYYEHKVRSLQIESAKNKGVEHIDKDGIRKFLQTIYYPLFFLDFETMMPAVPLFENTACYEQIPFQYSLHFIKEEGGEVMHKEFLAESGKDPREELAKRLVEDIPTNACVIAYNSSFERARIRELAGRCDKYSDSLLKIANNIVDLATPFENGCCYNGAMGNSLSIKSVLPALFPSDPTLNYNALEGVHNGSEAMSIYPNIAFMNKEDAKKARAELLAYCKLDTLAMVKIWQKLIELSK
jgi:hypothetical protein